MSPVAAAVAALLSGAVLSVLAIFGGTAALTPDTKANTTPVVNYDGS